MSGLVHDVYTLLFRQTGPRRERSAAIEEALSDVRQENIQAVKRNRDAVRELIDTTMQRVEKRDETGHESS